MILSNYNILKENTEPIMHRFRLIHKNGCVYLINKGLIIIIYYERIINKGIHKEQGYKQILIFYIFVRKTR